MLPLSVVELVETVVELVETVAQYAT